MMRYICWLALACLCGTAATAEEAPAPPPGAPTIQHAPVTTVLRGEPAHLVAKISPSGGAIVTSVTVVVRLTDVGKPVSFPMRSDGDAYSGEVPVSLVREVHRFWYYIHAADSLGRISDTTWYPVRILDGDSQQAAAGGFWTRRNLLIAGGVALLGGATWAIIDHQDDGGGEAPPAPGSDSPPVPSSGSRPASEAENRNTTELVTPAAPAPTVLTRCVTTGAEDVFYDGATLDPFDIPTPIALYLCNACTNADVRVVGSWNETVAVAPYNNASCDPARTIQLPKPPTPPAPESQTIQVFSNGTLIDSTLWPPPSVID